MARLRITHDGTNITLTGTGFVPSRNIVLEIGRGISAAGRPVAVVASTIVQTTTLGVFTLTVTVSASTLASLTKAEKTMLQTLASLINWDDPNPPTALSTVIVSFATGDANRDIVLSATYQ
jgi:hypothetical protein